MKKQISIFLVVIFVLASLAACGMKDDSKDDNENTTVETVGNETEDKNKEENDTNSNTNDDTNNEASEQDIKTDTTIIERDPSIVYMTKDISPEALIRIYEALGREASGKVAVKVHMGEPGGNNYLKPELVKDLVLTVNGTFVDSNTAYGGLRASTAAHMQAAKDHGFTEYAPVDILDAEGAISLPIENGKHLTEDLVGSHYEDYDFYIILSHFKGHAMGGFGGAIKNMSIGFATPKGKNLIHTAGARETNSWLSGGYIQNEFLESMAEAAKAIVDDAGENIIYISIMNNLSVDCDCDNSPAAPEMADIGILASLDPVALDKACVDQVYAAPEEESASLRTRIESRNGTHTLDYAQEIGVGTMSYELVNIDE